MSYIKFFTDISMKDIGHVGGKNASLGEMIHQLKTLDPEKKLRIPLGFAVTTQGYWDHLEDNGLITQMKSILVHFEKQVSISDVQSLGISLRRMIYEAPLPQNLTLELVDAYDQLSAHYGEKALDVAVRSSATAEDLPHASFAGQQDTFLNIKGSEALIDSVKKCMASLFTDRAIVYRNEQNFDHFQVGLSVGVQKMVRADKASSGVVFSLDTDSGFKNVVVITSSYGLGENIVKGVVNPDEFHIHKETLHKGFRSLIKKQLGTKELKLIYGDTDNQLNNVPVPFEQQHSFSLSDADIFELARQTILIEDYYSMLNSRWCPMDIEWAKDGIDQHLYIVQARPETVYSRHKDIDTLVHYRLHEGSHHLLTKGLSIGHSVARGKARILKNIHEHAQFTPGDILVTSMTDPDWVPLMKKASAIVTDKGGRTCHAAIVSRELGIPAIIGTVDATTVIPDEHVITVDTSSSSIGHVYEGSIGYTITKTKLATLSKPRVPLLLNIADPDRAYVQSFLPVSGVGLARVEFIISNAIKIHPMAICSPEKISDPHSTRKISQLSIPYNGNPQTFFTETLAQGIGMIAAAFYPRPVTVRLSDFKTNEYRNLLAGEDFEPIEENPMLGFRGAVRYCDPGYAPAFALECAAIKKAREDMGFKNIKILVPFVRNLHEAGCTLASLKEHGLERGKEGLEILMMCEIPSNVILLEEFSSLFDGFSIGSNDLSQFTLAVDRDSEKLTNLFNERDPAVIKMLTMALDKAKALNIPMSICGQAPSDYPDIANLLIEHGINALSLNSDTVIPFLAQEPGNGTHEESSETVTIL
jgi:pyruvate,water dikinase